MKTVRILALIALGFLGITSVMGGLPLIVDPTGRLLHMPLILLKHSPFHSFLIPGIILFVANGLVSLVIFSATMRRTSGYGNMVASQGIVIAGWITVEVIFLRLVVWPHYVYWGVGLVLIGCGVILRRGRRAAAPIPVLTR